MARGEQRKRRLHAIRDVVALAEGAGIPTAVPIIQMLANIGQEFGALASDYRFVHKMGAPYSRELEYDIERWVGDRFLASIPQPKGVLPRLTLASNAEALNPPKNLQELIPGAWIDAMTTRKGPERDVLVSAAMFRHKGLGPSEARARLMIAFRRKDLSDKVSQALADAEALMAAEDTRQRLVHR